MDQIPLRVIYQEITPPDLNGDIMVQKGYFGLMANPNIFVYYPLVSSMRIKD